jgi:DNA-binding beta-propeller fold protein YncE
VERDGPYPSVLDRTIELPWATGSAIAALAAILIAVALRFIGLDRWPMAIAEADLALTAHNLVRGESVPNHLFGAPFTIEWTSLFLFSGGSADSVARLAMAFAGVLAVVGIMTLGRCIGTMPALSAAVALAASPTMVAASRRVDGGILLVTLTVAVIACALTARARGGVWWSAATGAALGLLILSGPLGLPAALLAAFGVYRLGPTAWVPTRDSALAALAALLGALLLSSTVLLTRPSGILASFGELFERLWDVHLARAGDRFYMPAFNLILNEPLLLALAVVALVASHQRALARDTAMWFFVTLVVVSLLGDVGPAGYALTVLPLGVLAGLGAAHLIERLPWTQFRRGPAAVYVIAVLLAAAAIASLFGLITGGVSDDATEWVLKLLLITGVGLLPLALTLTIVGRRLIDDRGVLVLAALLMVVGALTIRSSVLAASERPGEPGDPLAAGATGSDIPILVGRLQRISRDVTATVRDSRDPTGGHGLRIALDESVAQPFRWYFRDYPNLVVFDPALEAPPLDAQVIILSDARDARTVAAGYRGQNFLWTRDSPSVFAAPDWGDLVLGAINPNDWRRHLGFLIDRELAVEPTAREVQVLTAPEIAERLFPSTGPYTLDDRPGAGSGQGQFNRPRGIVIATDGTTYVVDSRNARVEVFDPSGVFLQAFGGEGALPGQFARFPGAGGGGPGGIAIGSDGNLYVADTWNHRIQVFSPQGQYIREWGTFFDTDDDPTLAATHPGEFYGPRGIAIHNGRVYVTDTGNERVQVFDETGAFVSMFGGAGSAEGQLVEPVGIAVTDDGTVLVADSHNARIARFSADGQALGSWPVAIWQDLRFFEPYLALGNDGTLYATTSQSAVIVQISADGIPLEPLRSSELRQPFGIAVTPDGSQLLVTDGALNAVVRVVAR